MTLTLTHNQALVLFELLSRSDVAVPVEDAAEERVLWLVEAQLEKLLAEPFGGDYGKVLARARKEVRDGG